MWQLLQDARVLDRGQVFPDGRQGAPRLMPSACACCIRNHWRQLLHRDKKHNGLVDFMGEISELAVP